MKRAISVDDAPTPAGPYSQAVEVGPWVFVAGQGPKDVRSGEMPDGIEAQTHGVLRNIEAILRGASCTLDDVVKVTAHLADLADFQAYNGVYLQYFKEPYPVRTTVGSQLAGILVEIDVIAYRDRDQR